MIIGIDLGTTNSVVAWMNQDRPELIPNALGDFLTPSVVGIDIEGDLLVGRTAKEHQVVYPERCASLFKRHMGCDWSTKICGRKFTPEQLSGLILRSLKEDAESHLGQTITRAVISVPAYFNDPQRKATIRAAQIAELEVDRILNEPTAASIAYGLHDSDDEKVIAVFDLGGGTFDVSIVELFDGTVEVRSSAGESFLGGEDFTRAMVAHILQSQGRQFERVELETPALVSRLIQQCERAKCQLTGKDSVQILLPDDNGEMSENPKRETITRAQFQDWTERVLSRVELPIRRALSDAKLKRADIDEVILVGGATRMPAVVDRVATWFDKTPHSRLDPDHVVALGAAVQAGLIEKNQSLDDLVVTDVAPFTLGINISKDFGTERRSGYFMPIVHRNTTIPVSRVDRVSTADANQTEILVEIYQGESRMVKDNLLLGELRLTGIPSGPAGQEVDVRFTYDLNGVLEVEATIVKTKKKVNVVITKHAGGISERQIARAVEQMQSLKTHLREETVNRFLTKRAERIYRELPPTDRWQLSELLDGFETALEAREPQVIDEFRLTLEAFLDRFEQGLSDGWGENDDPS